MGELTIPATIDDIDVAWLTAALRAGGQLDNGSVASFDVEQIGVGVGLMGYLYRITLSYDGAAPEAPSTVIVKLPVQHDMTRQVARAYRFYEKEVKFYNSVAGESPLRPPAAYHARHDAESDDFVLVAEDVGHLRAPDQVAGCSHDDALAAVTALAEHHAAFWNDARFGTDLVWLPFGSDPPIPQALAENLAQCLPAFFDVCGDLISPDVRAACEWLPNAVEDLLRPVPGHPITLVHGDYRLDNLFFHDDDRVTAVDWQICVKSVGAYDVGYFVSQSLSVEDRRALMDELTARYLSTLAANGVEYSEDDFRLGLQRTLLFCLAYPMQASALDLTDPRARELARTLAERAASAVTDSGALALVNA